MQSGEVFATSAGGPGSHLARVNKAKYIIHVAAVQAVLASRTVIPYNQPDQIENCVRGSLAKFAEINVLKGVISPADTEQHQHQKTLAEAGRGTVQSILFPLFGTGQGGLGTGAVLGPMFSGMEGSWTIWKKRRGPPFPPTFTFPRTA